MEDQDGNEPQEVRLESVATSDSKHQVAKSKISNNRTPRAPVPEYSSYLQQPLEAVNSAEGEIEDKFFGKGYPSPSSIFDDL